jgi:hypothetical protein
MTTRKQKDQGSAKITESPRARPDESLSESQLRQIPPSPAPTLPEHTEAEAQTPQASKSITKSPDSNLEVPTNVKSNKATKCSKVKPFWSTCEEGEEDG